MAELLLPDLALRQIVLKGSELLSLGNVTDEDVGDGFLGLSDERLEGLKYGRTISSDDMNELKRFLGRTGGR